MQHLRDSNGSSYNILTNQQTGNSVYLVDLGSAGYVYIEQHKKLTIQANEDGDGTYTAIATHLFEGPVASVTDCACLDDALEELEFHYQELLYRWHRPQTLGL